MLYKRLSSAPSKGFLEESIRAPVKGYTLNYARDPSIGALLQMLYQGSLTRSLPKKDV